MKAIRLFSRGLRDWIRDSHCYLGLFISPFILLFALTAILFNHKFRASNTASDVKIETRIASVEIPTYVGGVAQIKQIMRQVDVSGEVIAARHLPTENQLKIVAMRPGQRININVDLKHQTAEIERRHTGIWRALLYLHRSPGPHNIKHRANWLYTKLWAFLADATVYLFCFISVSGIYIWYIIKSERKIGIILLGAGCLSFFLIILAIVG
ncbi:PepSY-associated TM helix domain-containing protein [bacterium]|nr:PepSY-associated TM helix domain-containing protein [bacterium]